MSCTCCGSGITSPCCLGFILPSTLHVTITDAGGCACLAGTYTIDYVGLDQAWETPAPAAVCGSVFGLSISLKCLNNTTWDLNLTCGSPLVKGVSPTSVVCSPFDLVFGTVATIGGSDCCTGNITIEVTT